MSDRDNNHTRIERFLHNLAFKPWFPRISLSTIESLIFKNQLSDISVEKPVFITALPRSGTTLLLKLCVETGEFASHTYRDMPFFFTPLLWDRFSRNFRNTGTLTERVHGDGILVNLDSPESFEEILWKEFWPSYYKKNWIIPWKEARYQEFEDFFYEQMRKTILLRGTGNQIRYISKNNLNIARINYLCKIFPDSTIIVMFRSPLQHAASLLKQHLNFLEIHKNDPFAQKYMADTGHYDFGENLRPIDFDNWYSNTNSPNSRTFSFWLEYWINTYQYLLKKKNNQIEFFSFDSLCEEPKDSLERLGLILEMDNCDKLMKNIDRIKSPTPHAIDTNDIPRDVLEQSNDLFIKLQNAES